MKKWFFEMFIKLYKLLVLRIIVKFKFTLILKLKSNVGILCRLKISVINYLLA